MPHQVAATRAGASAVCFHAGSSPQCWTITPNFRWGHCITDWEVKWPSHGHPICKWWEWDSILRNWSANPGLLAGGLFCSHVAVIVVIYIFHINIDSATLWWPHLNFLWVITPPTAHHHRHNPCDLGSTDVPCPLPILCRVDRWPPWSQWTHMTKAIQWEFPFYLKQSELCLSPAPERLQVNTGPSWA